MSESFPGLPLDDLFDACEALLHTVEGAGEDFRVYDWRPIGQAELPAVYLWLGDDEAPSTEEAIDRLEDTFRVLFCVACSYGNDRSRIGLYGRRLSAVLDTELKRLEPLVGIPARAYRRGLRLQTEQFGQNQYALCLEFPVEVVLVRHLITT